MGNIGNEVQCTLCGTVFGVQLQVCLQDTCDSTVIDTGCTITVKNSSNVTVFSGTYAPGQFCRVYNLPVLPVGTYTVFAGCTCNIPSDTFVITTAPNLCAGADKFWPLIPNTSITGIIDLNNYLGTGVVLGATTCWTFVSGPDGMLVETCGNTDNNLFDFVSYPPALGNYVFTFETCTADGGCCDEATITLEIV
jgi:hypothetical protein